MNDEIIWVMDSECCSECGTILECWESDLCSDCWLDQDYDEDQDDFWYPEDDEWEAAG